MQVRSRVFVRVLSQVAIAVALVSMGLSGASLAASVERNQVARPVSMPLTKYVDNDGISAIPGKGNFDGSGHIYAADLLPKSGKIEAAGVPFLFPDTRSGAADNVVALGQTLDLPNGKYHGAYLLVASSDGTTSGTVIVHYASGGTTQAPLTAPDWDSAGGGAINTAYRYSAKGRDKHAVHMYVRQVWFDSSRTATKLTLPKLAKPAANQKAMHIFALSLQPAVAGRAVMIMDIHSTMTTMPRNLHSTLHSHSRSDNRLQVVEATVVNAGSQWLTPKHHAIVTVHAHGVRTVRPARITELAPGEQAPLNYKRVLET